MPLPSSNIALSRNGEYTSAQITYSLASLTTHALVGLNEKRSSVVFLYKKKPEAAKKIGAAILASQF